ncbi:Scr1 family TA system antitoxin-like transcriptional regulator [Streptomyces kaniharaensis]|uniref:Scr1 family TA system antitoxin-like transcriptional regulator n=1 Tax=Streptomyces kaniharaensis TaxID=212423 RepID=UPI0018A80E3D|nr:Scr1 family TA system antitoxin-like transcriptional regulator [Streptomyces kaniharaensis]
MTRKKSTNPNLRSSAASVFGAVLRRLRESKGVSQGQLAILIPCSRPHISRIEAGTRNPQEDFVLAADRLLETGGQLMDLWKEIDWYARVEHPDWFRRYAGYEDKASTIGEFQVAHISGLLQTEAYARVLLGSGDAAGNPELIEERVASRLARQHRITAPDGPLFMVVHSEAAIRLLIGGPEVMYEQLGHLLAVGRLPNVVIQIAPFSLGERVPFDTIVSLITSPDGRTRVYSESLDQGHFIEDPREVQRKQRAYDLLQAEALSPRESADLIRSVREGLLNMIPTKADASWRKSSYSGNNGGNCIEVATASPGRLVRDSKDPDGPTLGFTPTAWQSFVDAVRADEFPSS